MNKLYAAISSRETKQELIKICERFSGQIEFYPEAVIFDISGTENLFGSPKKIGERIVCEMNRENLSGNVAIAENGATALLLAQNNQGLTVSKNDLEKLSLENLLLKKDLLRVFSALGIKKVKDLKKIPENDLISRYGEEFRGLLRLANNKASFVLTPNTKENFISWKSQFDFCVHNFEQLIFILSTGIKKVLVKTASLGFSTERIEITFGLENKTAKTYIIEIGFPSLEASFWIELINLRIEKDPPESEINAVSLICHFADLRSVQKGLFASTKPEPEALQLTAEKIKKIVGDENVGVPVLLNQRLPKSFMLDPAILPVGQEFKEDSETKNPALVMKYFEPPIPAKVVIRGKKLIKINTKNFSGKVVNYGGVWKESSQWWQKLFWQTLEWDVELENRKVYRLQKSDNWQIIGEYD